MPDCLPVFTPRTCFVWLRLQEIFARRYSEDDYEMLPPKYTILVGWWIRGFYWHDCSTAKPPLQ